MSKGSSTASVSSSSRMRSCTVHALSVNEPGLDARVLAMPIDCATAAKAAASRLGTHLGGRRPEDEAGEAGGDPGLVGFPHVAHPCPVGAVSPVLAHHPAVEALPTSTRA